jgi:hypothetical protein
MVVVGVGVGFEGCLCSRRGFYFAYQPCLFTCTSGASQTRQEQHGPPPKCETSSASCRPTIMIHANLSNGTADSSPFLLHASPTLPSTSTLLSCILSYSYSCSYSYSFISYHRIHAIFRSLHCSLCWPAILVPPKPFPRCPVMTRGGMQSKALFFRVGVAPDRDTVSPGSPKTNSRLLVSSVLP